MADRSPRTAKGDVEPREPGAALAAMRNLGTEVDGLDQRAASRFGSPDQTPASAVADPAAQLYTDSDVNLDAATDKLRWYYRGVPNDFKDLKAPYTILPGSLAYRLQ